MGPLAKFFFSCLVCRSLEKKNPHKSLDRKVSSKQTHKDPNTCIESREIQKLRDLSMAPRVGKSVHRSAP